MAVEDPWPEIEPRAVLRALGFPEPAGLEPVLGGWDTALYRFQTADGSSHALRVFRTPDRAHGAMRERVALEAAAAAALPVPAVEASGGWRGLPAFVLSWCPGERMVESIQRRPWSLWRLARELGRLQARVHALPIPDALREGAPHYRQYSARWEDGGLYDSILASRPGSETFLHGDFHPLNVLSDGREITAVLDWCNATAGDVRADLAWTTTLLRVAPPPPGPLMPVFKLARWLFYDAWRRGYESLAGPMPDLAPFLAWAGTVFLREATPRMDEPQVWATEKDMLTVRRWVERWKERAGIG